MQANCTTFRIPENSFLSEQIFDDPDNYYEIFNELNQIAEELEVCRLRNCS